MHAKSKMHTRLKCETFEVVFSIIYAHVIECMGTFHWHNKFQLQTRWNILQCTLPFSIYKLCRVLIFDEGWRIIICLLENNEQPTLLHKRDTAATESIIRIMMPMMMMMFGVWVRVCHGKWNGPTFVSEREHQLSNWFVLTLQFNEMHFNSFLCSIGFGDVCALKWMMFVLVLSLANNFRTYEVVCHSNHIDFDVLTTRIFVNEFCVGMCVRVWQTASIRNTSLKRHSDLWFRDEIADISQGRQFLCSTDDSIIMGAYKRFVIWIFGGSHECQLTNHPI